MQRDRGLEYGRQGRHDGIVVRITRINGWRTAAVSSLCITGTMSSLIINPDDDVEMLPNSLMSVINARKLTLFISNYSIV